MSELHRAIDFVRSRCSVRPSTAIVLGSGLGGLAPCIEDAHVIPYAEIPGVATASAGGHRGELIVGQLESTPVVAMSGRLHRYEGWTINEIVFPIRMMAALGAERLILSNAAGGLNPKLCVGDIVVIRDHINWIPGCHFGASPEHPGCLMRRHDLYDAEMSDLARKAATEALFNACFGTYLATPGPTYETRSECRMMRRIGADVVGMSTVPEVLAAADEKMRVLGLSLVTNVANPDRPIQADHAEVVEAAEAAAARMEAIVRAVVPAQ